MTEESFNPGIGSWVDTQVRLEGEHYRSRTSRVVTKRASNVSAKRISGWIVRVIMLATTVFALIDLSLLIRSLH